jgi:curved DNA-binding protein CbpA
MPRNPFAVLELPLDATADAIKAAWRRLARQHHPDVSSGDPVVEKRANRTMAEINAAYKELQDPAKRRVHREVAARAAKAASAGSGGVPASGSTPYSTGVGQDAPWEHGPTDTSSRPNARPVTGRIDTSALLRPRNSTLHPLDRSPLPGLPPRPRYAEEHEPPRASTPTGPMHRRRGSNAGLELPSLADALETRLKFGKFEGRTLGEVAASEPSYLEWIVRTIDRDPEIAMASRVVLRHVSSGQIKRPRLDTFIPRG